MLYALFVLCVSHVQRIVTVIDLVSVSYTRPTGWSYTAEHVLS